MWFSQFSKGRLLNSDVKASKNIDIINIKASNLLESMEGYDDWDRFPRMTELAQAQVR